MKIIFAYMNSTVYLTDNNYLKGVEIMKKISLLLLIIACLIMASVPAYAQNVTDKALPTNPDVIGVLTNNQTGEKSVAVLHPMQTLKANSSNEGTLLYEATLYSTASGGMIQEPRYDSTTSVKFVFAIHYNLSTDSQWIRLTSLDGTATILQSGVQLSAQTVKATEYGHDQNNSLFNLSKTWHPTGLSFNYTTGFTKDIKNIQMTNFGGDWFTTIKRGTSTWTYDFQLYRTQIG